MQQIKQTFRRIMNFLRCIAPFHRSLSTVGTDDPRSTSAWFAAGATRVCRIGRMQRPPLIRPHDGEDWIRATGIAVSAEFQNREQND